MTDNISQDQAPKKHIRHQNSELNIESIISAPLIAASKANVMMLTGQTRFLLDFCFNKVTSTSTNPNTGENITKERYDPILIEMLMNKTTVVPAIGKPGEEGYVPEYFKNEALTFTIPMLCIIPINSLGVDKVNVDFKLDITSSTSYVHTASGVLEKQAQLKGKISKEPVSNNNTNSNKYNTKSSSLLNVTINAGTLPLPIGVLSILDIYSKAIQPAPITPSN